MDDGLRRVQSRACAAWVLPGNATCAGVARRLFRQVASGLALDPEIIDDGVIMVSELAANTLHAAPHQAVAANPELWLYLRGTGPRAELVCKVFDTLPGWVRGNVPGRTIRRAPADAMSGRGLEVVHELSAGRWGHHLSRARLSAAVLDGAVDRAVLDRAVLDRAVLGGAGLDDTGLDGKAVWFSLPAPAVGALGGSRPRPATAAEAMTLIEQDLRTRGLEAAMVRADDAGANMAVLSIVGGLAVWCRGGVAWLRVPGVPVQQWDYCDLVEVAEQTVQAYESVVALAEPFPLANATRTGSLTAGRQLTGRRHLPENVSDPGGVSRSGRRRPGRRRARPPRSGRRRSR